MYGDLVALILKLAARECGCRSDDPAFAGYTSSQICNSANKQVMRGRLFKARLAHKDARYFTSKERADAVTRNAEITRKMPRLHKVEANTAASREGWATAEPVITKNTVFTRCPNYVPQFESFDIPNTYGGNQRGRVTR